jgi:iron complex outermembrane receptor protein
MEPDGTSDGVERRVASAPCSRQVDQNLTLIGNYVATPPVFVTVLGNPNFKPEVMIGWEAGYRQLFTPKLYMDLSVFHNQYDDLESYGEPIFTITFPTQPYPYTSLNATFANGVKGVTDGLELAPDWKPFSWLDLRGTYSHLHMALHSKAGFNQASYVASYEGSSPDHIATIQSLITLPHGIEIDPDYRYMSALPAQDAPAYQTADAHLAWKIKKHFQLSVDGRNLLQPSHREFLGDNGNQVGIKREVYGGIAWIP